MPKGSSSGNQCEGEDRWLAKEEQKEEARPGGPDAQWAQEDPQYSPICFWQLVFG